MKSMTIKILACLLLSGTAACSGPGWGTGMEDEALSAAEVSPNQVAVNLGPDAWQQASSDLTAHCEDHWPEGIKVSGETTLPAVWGAPLATSTVAWTDVALHPGVLQLEAGPMGLGLRVELQAETFDMVLSTPEHGSCPVTLTQTHGTLKAWLKLGATKMGRLKASTLSGVSWSGETGDVNLASCPPEVRNAVTDGGHEGLFHATLAEAAVFQMAPWISAAVPEALDLDIAGAANMRFSGDGTGSGTLRWALRASSSEDSAHYVDGRLVVPFGLAMQVEAHPCAPSMDWTPPPGAALPPVDVDSAMVVNQATLDHTLKALWMAGAACNERLTQGLHWPASDLVHHWAALDALDPDTQISLRMWPLTPPSVAFEMEDGLAMAQLDGGTWTLEFMGTMDDTVLRLASIDVSFQATARPTFGPQGSIWLEPSTVETKQLGARPGLLKAPTADLTGPLADPLAERLVASVPVGALPGWKSLADPEMRVQDSHLIIHGN